MEKKSWTSSDIRKVFHFKERHKSPQSLFNAEEKGEIPKAERIARGKIQVRHWKINHIPTIGGKFGYLSLPQKQKIICKYIQKGGVLKTTTTFNEARTFALNGIKTLIIGLDFECSITDIVLPKTELFRLEDASEPLGLYNFLAEDASLEQIILKTSLPTLDIIPEKHDLVVLDKWLNQQKRREYVFKDKLMPYLSNYDAIIFDNGPSWNHLIENSIISSDYIICPLGCNLLAYNASDTNISSIFEFQNEMRLNNQKIIMFSTLLDRTSISQQINAQYITKFTNYLIPNPIRISVKLQEALLNGQSIIEYAPTSSVSQEYFELINSIWQKINKNREI